MTSVVGEVGLGQGRMALAVVTDLEAGRRGVGIALELGGWEMGEFRLVSGGGEKGCLRDQVVEGMEEEGAGEVIEH